MSITEMIHFEKCWQTYKVLSHMYMYLTFNLVTPVFLNVSNKSRRVTLATCRLY